MVRVPTEVAAAERARWLGELSDALEEARELIQRLWASPLCDGETLDLAARVDTARAQVRVLRLARRGDPLPYAPEWSRQLLWNGPDHGD